MPPAPVTSLNKSARGHTLEVWQSPYRTVRRVTVLTHAGPPVLDLLGINNRYAGLFHPVEGMRW